VNLEEESGESLRRAPSNRPQVGDGATVYRQIVLRQRVDGLDVVARAAFRWLAEASPSAFESAGAGAVAEVVKREVVGDRTLVCGAARLKDAYDRPDDWISVAAVSLGDGERFVFLGRAHDAERGERAMEEI